ncbi:MAG: Wzz/FepE/Etk N-terminal domain-containing protein [Clostridia bacterium]
MRNLTLKDIIAILRNRIVLIIILPIVTMTVAAYLSFNVIVPTYVAQTSLYVLNTSNEQISSSDLTAGLQLIEDYREIAKSNSVVSGTARKLELPDLKGYDIDVSSVNDSRVLRISVTGTDPTMTANVANELAAQFTERVMEILKVDNVSVIDSADTPTIPFAPKKAQNILIAGLVGLVTAIAVSIAIDMLNTTVRTSDDIEEQLKLPVLARIPKIEEKKS